jgi:cysteine-rich repeat protein
LWLAIAISWGCGEEKAAAPVADSAIAVDTQDDLASGDSDVGGLDLQGGDTQSLVCPGGAYCPCADDGECDSGFCLDSPKGKVCAALCTGGGCDEAWSCAKVNSKSGDIVNLCVPRWGFLCEPCTASAQCAEALGSTGANCIDYGGASGAFCGAPCQTQADCPSDYNCADATTIEGKPTRQCLRPKDKEGLVQCSCDPRAVALKLTTECKAPNELGSCPGYRVCDDKGLSSCQGLKPTAEVCDGVDNDCNGKTDDGLCDDANQCTLDGCDPKTAKCTVQVLEGVPCSDGNACTGPDVCAGDQCKGGPSDCDDKNPCTDDSCEPSKGCVNSGNTKPCTDNNACTDNDLCDGKGACLGLAVDVSALCNDNNGCTSDVCDPSSGCTHPAQAGVCEDGNPCTNGDQCSAGQCLPGQNICGCNQNADCASKEDGNLCNGTLYCDKAKAPYVCTIDPKTVVVCDSSKDTPCLQKLCSPATGKCQDEAAVEGKLCNADDSVCTKNDACKGGLCTPGGKISCADDEVCTDDVCDPKNGCSNPANSQACDDGNKCTPGDSCKGGICVAGAKTICDDKSACTNDKCDSTTGECKFDGTAFEGSSCDADGTVCTVGDSCASGKCQAGPALKCNDANPCTDDSCNAATGCVKTNNIAVCDDGLACTLGDACKNGACAGGAAKNCDDKSPCTKDSCDGLTGVCKHSSAEYEGAACDDGDKCTENDLCQSGVCIAGPKVDCDDKNACTIDGCLAATGCKAPVNVADSTACDDGDICTKSDVCVAGSCAGIKFVCNDGNSCTQDQCAVSGCSFKPVADTTDCGAGNWCVAGACKTPSCGDGYIDAKTGETCDDGNTAACDSCENCKPRGVLTLDGKSWAEATVAPGPPGTETGDLALDKEMTVEAWIRPDSFGTTMGIASKAKVSAPAQAAWTLGLMATSGQLFFNHIGPEGGETITGTVAVTAGKWNHVAAVVSEGRLRLYVNGQPAATANLTKFRSDAPGVPVQIGRRYADLEAELFVGAIDAVRLTAAPLYGAAFVPTRVPVAEAETRALWLFDDAAAALATGVVSTDSGPHANSLKKGGLAKIGADNCYGAPANAAVCGDGVVAAAFEVCDDKNSDSCDGCKGCQLARAFDVATTHSANTSVINKTWAPDAFCPTCEITLEAWVRVDQVQQGGRLIAGTSDLFLGLMVSGGKFALIRYPGTLLLATDSYVLGKWYHVAAVVGWATGSQPRLYVDGVLQPLGAPIPAVPPIPAPQLAPETEVLMVGAGSPGVASGSPVKPQGQFPGVIDELRVSAGARYTDNFLPPRRLRPDRMSRGLWRFDEALGTKSFGDDSGNQIALVAATGNTVADTCWGEGVAERCGDGQKAKFEACDSGPSNGPPPNLCSAVCTKLRDVDCTAMSYSGVTVISNNIMEYNTPSWAIDGWVKLNALPASGVGWIVGVADSASPFMCGQPAGQEWYLGVNPNGSDASVLGGLSQVISPTKQVWKAGVWQHFALQYEGYNRGTLWVDGAKIRSYTAVSTAWGVSCPVSVGNSTASKSLAGALASLRLSGRSRFGQPFQAPWTLGDEAGTKWRFDFANPGTGATKVLSTNTAYSLAFKAGAVGFVSDGPHCK